MKGSRRIHSLGSAWRIDIKKAIGSKVDSRHGVTPSKRIIITLFLCEIT